MKERSTILLIVLMLSLAAVVRGQSLPAPEPAAMVRNINVPVNLYNGVASVSVPIYNVPANNGAGVPIALQYNASGIRVNQMASSVGLGWQLVAGGAITRVVKGQPDDQPVETPKRAPVITGGWRRGGIPIVRNDGGCPNSEPDLEFFEDLLSGGDGEHDMYHFSYPGNQGRFTRVCDYDKDGNSVFLFKSLPHQDIRIEYFPDEDHWEIRDTFGNRYVFGSTAESRETTQYNSTTSGTYDLEKANEFVTTWHLSEID